MFRCFKQKLTVFISFSLLGLHLPLKDEKVRVHDRGLVALISTCTCTWGFSGMTTLKVR